MDLRVVKSKKKSDIPEAICRKRKDDAENATAIKRTFDFCDIFCNIVGWQFSYVWKSNPRYWFTLGLGLFFLSQCIYSQITFFVNGEYRKLFEVFALYGVVASYAQKIWIFTNSYKQLTALRNFCLKITVNASQRMVERIKAQQLKNFKLYRLLMVIIFLIDAIFSCHPISELVYRRKLVPLLPIKMMFLDQTKLSGFLLVTLIETVTSALCTVMFLIITVVTFLSAISNCSTQVDLIENDFGQLDTLWVVKKPTTLIQRHMLLRNICQKCQDRDNYMKELKKIFDGPIFCFFCFSYMAQIVCLYEIKKENWIPGYVVAVASFVEMLMYCFIGTKASKTNERLYYVLTQTQWYNYDIPSQKIFLNLLNSCMNTKDLWIGPLAPLSVVTGIEVVKSIYSYYTLLSKTM